MSEFPTTAILGAKPPLLSVRFLPHRVRTCPRLPTLTRTLSSRSSVRSILCPLTKNNSDGSTRSMFLHLRRWVAPLILCISLVMVWPPTGNAYGVLTHQQLIDQAWNAIIVPILLSRFPSLTTEQLRE